MAALESIAACVLLNNTWRV